MTHKKLLEIEGLIQTPTSKNLSRVLELTNDADEEVRLRSIEALGVFTVTDEALSRIREAISDSDELVRVECAELLGDWEDESSLESLYTCTLDQSELVRSAAITAIGKIGRKDSIPFLIGKHSNWASLERLSSAMALYRLGKATYLDDILSSLTDSDYRVRCATANFLSYFGDDANRNRVITALKEAKLKETTRAALTTISDVLTELEGEE